jgi:hypothetical protein
MVEELLRRGAAFNQAVNPSMMIPITAHPTIPLATRMYAANGADEKRMMSPSATRCSESSPEFFGSNPIRRIAKTRMIPDIPTTRLTTRPKCVSRPVVRSNGFKSVSTSSVQFHHLLRPSNESGRRDAKGDRPDPKLARLLRDESPSVAIPLDIVDEQRVDSPHIVGLEDPRPLHAQVLHRIEGIGHPSITETGHSCSVIDQLVVPCDQPTADILKL